MAAVEMIYLLAAILWIGVVLAALCIGVRFAIKFRARRRRMNRLLGVVRLPVSFLAEAFDVPRKHVARGSRQAPRRRR